MLKLTQITVNLPDDKEQTLSLNRLDWVRAVHQLIELYPSYTSLVITLVKEDK
jgi:hypothetical protein